MQKYKCHKIVEAGLITAFDGEDVVLEGGEHVHLTAEVYARIDKMIDGEGYLVRYEDGYLSWSPKPVFDAGYSEVIP